MPGISCSRPPVRSGRASLSIPPKLVVQALHRLRFTSDTQERALAVGALLENLAGREDLAAHLLRDPGEEQLGLDEVALEERGDCLAQRRDVGLAAGAHHDASPILRP